MSVILARLPLQLVCQLIIPETPAISNTNFAPAVDQSLPEVLPDGYVRYPDIGAAYKIYNEIVSWKVARKRCILDGAKLALIDSVKKLDYVTGRRVTNDQVIHVGIHSLFDDNDWVDVRNGTSVEFVPWAKNEPYGNYSCVMVKSNENGLTSDGCAVPGNYVCEIPIPKS